MRQYKGYYIDKVIFHNENEIDAFIKNRAIEKYQMLCKMFANKADNALATIMVEHEDRLHDIFGLSYEEIEKIEIEAICA